jgi:hypothetical protein
MLIDVDNSSCEDDSLGPNTGAIIGALIGAAVLIVFIAIALRWHRMKQKRKALAQLGATYKEGNTR